MITEVRKTISGTEYWDSKEKRILFVPTDEEPGFEVTVNPDSMILGMDSSIEPDKTVVNLNDMTVKQLREYADELGVEIPADVKKKEDIIELLS
ncbi:MULTISPECIES: Rho termination factor N-terminal domain-containing protein [Bacillus]|uniref:Rho termination factor N-terminal domain-containing protein n=1 Tax=Bacillus TaxID=1386 RepID=UPI000CFC72C3|nr:MULTISPECIES: Rho termination factor N-terminal domain-containing protein [Bacillus]PQZ54625.1 hypothetical protein CQZ94_17015 [Bacillus sp. MYb209]